MLGEDEDTFPVLSDRSNIVVIADEAHRTQYGFDAKLKGKPGEERYQSGYAQHLRDALPNATFVAFTGTPVSSEDRDIGAMVDATRTAAIAAAAKAGAVNSTQTSVTPLLDILASWKIGAYILLVTLVFWFIRLLVRLFLSNIHLENDAAERVNVYCTYA